jgi:hypothetical protein
VGRVTAELQYPVPVSTRLSSSDRLAHSRSALGYAEGEVTAYRVRHDDARSPVCSIGLHNWSDGPPENRVRWSDIHLDPSPSLRLTPESAAQGAAIRDGVIRIPD